MKVRFVLQPFSFVFLLAGTKSYHIVLETLDTGEAIYIWYSEKSQSALIDVIKQIDKELNIIKEKGRQAYLETNPNNFSRIINDYSDSNKRFSTWNELAKLGLSKNSPIRFVLPLDLPCLC